MTRLLLLLSLSLAAVLAYQWTRPPAPVDAPAGAAVPEETEVTRSDPPALESESFDTYAEIAERPLFSPTRRPPTATETAAPAGTDLEEEEAPAPSPTLDKYMLSGVSLGPAGQLALIVDKRSRQVQRVERGGLLDGWKVTGIEAGRVMLSNGEKVGELVLVRGSGQLTGAQIKTRPRKKRPVAPPQAPPQAPAPGAPPKAAANAPAAPAAPVPPTAANRPQGGAGQHPPPDPEALDGMNEEELESTIREIINDLQ